MADIEVRDESSLWIVLTETALGQDWLEANLQVDALRWAGGFVVEPRYICAILRGACREGLEVAT